eukprot:TRINITY_DN18089_c0_g1_i1.p1 TRINITY_DN18089_c0_g1~~TRINITY_DN18089_c0_g1_i1.p1  ORF type:complete len:549 (+),score=77.22 TRINITY_DN18089_c0_g1_i1:21-1667(+)
MEVLLLAVLLGGVTGVVITDPAYNETLQCDDPNCDFYCTKNIGSCLRTKFNCTNKCTIYCDSKLSCGFIDLYCLDRASCNVVCNAQSCFGARQWCAGAICWSPTTVARPATGGKMILMEAFVLNNMSVWNIATIPDGSVQMLSDDISQRNKGTLAQDVRDTVVMLSSHSVYRYPTNFSTLSFDVPNPYLMVVSGSSHDFEIAIQSTIDLYAKDHPTLVSLFRFIKFDYSTEDLTLTFVIEFHPTGHYTLSILELLFSLFIQQNTVDLLDLPDTSFLNVTQTTVNTTCTYVVQVLHFNCRTPVPFYGAYCYGGEWQSSGDITLTLSDLVMQPSVHKGSMTASAITFVVSGTLYTIENDFNLLDGSLLTVNNSDITVSQTVSFNQSSLQILAMQETIKTVHLNIIQSDLSLTLSNDHTDQLIASKSLEVPVFNASSVVGTFDSVNIVVDVPHILSSTGCKSLQTSQNKHPAGLGVVLSLSGCSSDDNSNGNAQNQTILTIALSASLSVLVVGVFLCVLIRCRYIRKEMKLKEKLSALGSKLDKKEGATDP